MRVLLDTDVLLDVALSRQEFLHDSAAVLDWAEQCPGQAAVAWHTLSNLAYLVRPDPRQFIHELLQFVDVPAVDTSAANQALGFPMADIEDALQAAAALAFRADCIVTRNTRDFKGSPVSAITPGELLRRLVPEPRPRS